MAPPPVEQIGESTSGEAHRSLPTPFLSKTYQLVDDPSIDDIISWSDDGSTFIVWRPAELARDLLPKYFKHNNFSSFVRQLNTYGFRKIVPDRWEFANDCFRRGQKRLLCEIHRRKIPPAVATTAITTAAVTASVAGSPTNSGNEQVRSSSSSPTIVAATLCRTRSCSSTAELQDENERLKRENMHLAHELTQMKNLCNSILVLMANYAGGSQQETSVFLTEKALDLLPAKRFSNEAVAAGEYNKSQAKTDDETSPRLFGVSIGVKRTRGCEEDEEQEQQTEQSQSQKPGSKLESEPLDQISDHQDRHWIKYCPIPNQRVCN